MPFRNKFTTWALPTAWGNWKPKQDVFLKGEADLPYFLIIKTNHPPGCYCCSWRRTIKIQFKALKSPILKVLQKKKKSLTVLRYFWQLFCTTSNVFHSFKSDSASKLVLFFGYLSFFSFFLFCFFLSSTS